MVTRNITSAKVISLPFSFASGSVNVLRTDDKKYWRDKIYTVLTTEDYERVWYKHFGASVQSYLFSPSPLAASEAAAAVSEAITRWVPEVTLEDIRTSYDQDLGELKLDITYSLPSGELDSTIVITADLTASGENIKVVYNG